MIKIIEIIKIIKFDNEFHVLPLCHIEAGTLPKIEKGGSTPKIKKITI